MNHKSVSLFKTSFILFLLSFILLLSCRTEKTPPSYTINKSAIGNHAMVVTAHPKATEAGLAILKQGGNAVDAAVTVQFALAVVYPVAGNIGGGGFMVYRGHEGDIDCLDFREKAPLAAHKDMYLDSEGEVIPRLSLDGHLAAGVPGSVDGMIRAHQKYGSLPLAELIEPARQLAEKGFPITERQAQNLNSKKPDFEKNNRFSPVFIKEQKWKQGDLLIQKDLANTLALIQQNGREGFYAGPVADAIVAEMEAGKGLITYEDLAKYQSVWRKPLSMYYKDYSIISMPPASSGGIALLQLLKMVEDYPISEWGHNSAETVHLLTEAERRVYADRAAHLGDADFYPVPIDNLLDVPYIKNRLAIDFQMDKATPSTEVSAGQFTTPKESEQTTHFSIIDSLGNAVSITTTINTCYGSKTVVKDAGFLLNNEMDDFSAKPGTPNFYGLIGNEANAIAPEKRMLSSMTPSIVTQGDQLKMVVGTPGGSTIITSVFQTILNVIEFDMDMPSAVAAPRFHHQWLPDIIQMEAGAIDSTTIKKLEKKGHQFKERESIGRVDAILVLPDGKLQGGADPRGDDDARGW